MYLYLVLYLYFCHELESDSTLGKPAVHFLRVSHFLFDRFRLQFSNDNILFLTNLELVTQSLCQSVVFSGCHIACASFHCGKILLGWWLCFQCLLWWLVVVTQREKQRTKRAKVPCSKYQWTDQCWSRHMQCKKKYQRRASTNNRDYLFTCLWGACVLEKLPNLELETRIRDQTECNHCLHLASVYN